jgi:hypothetical protein
VVAGTLSRPMVSTFPQAQAIPTAQAVPNIMPTPTQQRRPRGHFINLKDVWVPSRGIIADRTRFSLRDAIEIVDEWMGSPPWIPIGDPDILVSNTVSQDSFLSHMVRMTNRDINAPDPHYNLEEGTFTFRGITPSFNNGGRNHHLLIIV